MATATSVQPSIHHDTPVPTRSDSGFWGSDVVAEVLRNLDIPYIALNPGASYRWLHDSLVNYLGNRNPQMLLCLHDETAVHLAQGYAKASGKMMAAALHANVGLMHACMPIFDAWCDRTPVLVFGATGPMDAAKRRPWIDWIHTCADQAGLVRNFTKWDNQPSSVAAATEAILRGAQIAQTAPRGPVYIVLDSAVQEEKLDQLPTLPDFSRYVSAGTATPEASAIARAAELLSNAKSPVMLVGRCSRDLDAWNARVKLAEKLNVAVLTQIKVGAAFPTDHPLHVVPPANRLAGPARELIAKADVVLSLDWLDLAGTFKQALGSKPVAAKVIQVSCDVHAHRGWNYDYQGLAPADVQLLCESDAAVGPLLDAVRPRIGAAPAKLDVPPLSESGAGLNLAALAQAFNAAVRGKEFCLTRLPLGWNGAYAHFRHPLNYIGYDGGAGVGSGPGITVGAALALKGSGRLPIGLHGDGDFLMGNTAVWTATHYKIPCLMVVCNNRSFFNDERHQEHIAHARGRPPENRWIGQSIGDPDIDIAAMARSMGAVGIGPVTSADEIGSAFARGVEAVENGAVCVLDARVQPGYDAD